MARSIAQLYLFVDRVAKVDVRDFGGEERMKRYDSEVHLAFPMFIVAEKTRQCQLKTALAEIARVNYQSITHNFQKTPRRVGPWTRG